MNNESDSPSRRYAAIVEYDGSAFSGWQRQSHAPSVQSALEDALSTVANEPIQVACAGRTDTGVHALGQVIHFETSVVRTSHQWILGVGSNTPPAMGLRWVNQCSPDFHARFSATARRYRYLILNLKYVSPLWRSRMTIVNAPLQADLMQQAADQLVGAHDFSAFRAASCQAPHARRQVHSIQVTRRKNVISIDVHANAFLHHMVRNIVGSLIWVGKREQPPEWVGEVLQSRDRNLAASTAPADGLYFMSVDYPVEFGIPKPEDFPDFSGSQYTP